MLVLREDVQIPSMSAHETGFGHEQSFSAVCFENLQAGCHFV